MSDIATKRNGSALSYIVAVVVLASADLGVVLSITVLRPTQDNAALVVEVIGFGATIIAALLALLKGVETAAALRETTRSVVEADRKITETKEQVKEVHATVNSKMSEMLLIQAKVSYAEGILAGAAEATKQAAVVASSVAKEVAQTTAEVAAASLKQAQEHSIQQLEPVQNESLTTRAGGQA